MQQADYIPWNLLAKHLQYVFENTTYKQQTTNLFPRFQKGQGKDLNNFVQIFARSIGEHSDAERRKYPEKYDPPDPSTILLDDDLVKRISPAIHRLNLYWLNGIGCSDNFYYSSKLCNHDNHNSRCTCPVRYEERKASSFLRQKKDNDCYEFWETSQLEYLNLEIVKTLLVSGDMEPILRVCAHPENDLQSWRCVAECQCSDSNIGWDHVYQRALEAYVCLNVLYCFPTLRNNKTEEYDYRRTKCYQLLVRNSAALGTGAVKPLHVDFFGIRDDQFSEHPRARKDGAFAHLGERLRGLSDEYPYGIMPIQDFLEFETVTSHVATASEVVHVMRMLSVKGLPVEIATEIMELAGYEPRRRLKVPHDPLHQDNAIELDRYLSLCWDLLLRCDMMGKALGEPIEWDVWVSQCIAGLFSASRKEDRVLSGEMYTWNSRGLYEFL